jgi:hypothetical protein
MEVVNGLLRGTLELKRGELILRALNTAVRNIRRVRFDLHQDEMIREIPNYPDQPSTDIDEPYEPSATPPREKKSPASEKPTWPHTSAAPTKSPQPTVQQPHPTPSPRTEIHRSPSHPT